jgi:drug/metabolite transporter (DMT)-like permease
MDYSNIYALLSLVCAGMNDIVFKRYSSKDRSRGMYIFGIGITWSILQTLAFDLKTIPLALDSTTIIYGLSAGLFLTLSNILLLESFTHINVSLGATIYRLNTIGVVILAFILLREPIGLVKSTGILCGVTAVLFLYNKDDHSGHLSHFQFFFWMVIVASVFRATYGVVSKIGISLNANPDTMLLLISSSWVVGGALYAKFRERRFRITGKKLAYSVVSGLLVFLIVNFLMLAIETGQASIVIPIANMSFIVALFIAKIMGMEVLNFRKCCAISLAVLSIALLAKA